MATVTVLSAGAVTTAAASPRPHPTASAHTGDRRSTADKTMVVRFFDRLLNHGDLSVIDHFVGPDIFRVDGGKIVEHWDVTQDVPADTVSGNDMFSTLSTPRRQWPDPRVSTATSRRVVTALVDEVTTGRDVTAFDRYAADPFPQHNPQSPDGTAAAKAFFASSLENPGFDVAVHSLYKFAPQDPGFTVLDLYRVRGGKAVEHWDVIRPVPQKSDADERRTT
ncbi:hypothetical protein ABZX85_27515 [Streptomyces sp. NPDC004539]|uniref:hypothetical protein n=1 Tax=Streptomyces sp. NPDC004539 TaxID=3154280 RepID=UPI0033AEEB25